MQNQNQSDYAKDSSDKPDNHIEYFAPKILWTIIGVLLFVGFVASFLWWQEIKKEEAIRHEGIESSQSIVPDWQTYRNDEYGFEFKYPSSLSLDDNNGDLKLGLFLTKPTTRPELHESVSERMIIAPTGLEGKTVFDYECDVSENTTLGDKTAKLCLNQSEFNYNKALRIINVESPWESDNIIFIDIPKFEGVEFGDKVVFDQILSTFKFIEAIPADWQTYRNDEYGFEFRYPKEWTVSSQENNIILSQADAQGSENILIAILPKPTRLAPILENRGSITVDGLTADQYLESGNIFVTYISMDAIYIKLSLPSGSDILNIYDQILSTFKFTN